MRDQQQLSNAEVYDRFFVPALFEAWGPIVSEAADIRLNQRVLDVACGTGTLACAAAERVGDAGSVVGLDPNQEMLEVARAKNTPIDWRSGQGESLPFPDQSFDAVVSQFGLMFFENQVKGLQEMMRVLRLGGRLAVAVCDGLDHSPGYAVLAELLHRLFGEQVAQSFRAPFTSGDRELLRTRCTEAGITNAEVRRHDGMVRFDSIEALISTERACAWTLGGILDADQFDRLREAAEESLAPFLTTDGRVAFVMPTLLVTTSRS